MITSQQKAEFQQQKIAQYEAELLQLGEKIEEIQAAKAVCEARLTSLNSIVSNAKGRRKGKKEKEAAPKDPETEDVKDDAAPTDSEPVCS